MMELHSYYFSWSIFVWFNYFLFLLDVWNIIYDVKFEQIVLKTGILTIHIKLNLSNKMNDLNFATTHENGGGRRTSSQPSTVSRYGTFSQQLFTIQGNSKKKADLGKKCFSGGILSNLRFLTPRQNSYLGTYRTAEQETFLLTNTFY